MIGPVKFLHVYCFHLHFFSARFLNVCKPGMTFDGLHSHLMDCPAWIAIIWKWPSALTRVAAYGESRLASFHVIRNFFANEIFNFSRLSNLKSCSTYLPILLYIISSLFSHFGSFKKPKYFTEKILDLKKIRVLKF